MRLVLGFLLDKRMVRAPVALMEENINPYAAPQAEVMISPPGDGALPLASPWRRLGASMLDGLIMLALFMPVMWVGGYFQRTVERASRGSSFSGEQILWAVVGFVILVAINWGFLGRGQTIGKSILKLRILRKDGAPATRGHIIFKRLLPVQIIANVPVVGGLFSLVDSLCIFRAGRNTLHDDIADTKVVDVRSQA